MSIQIQLDVCRACLNGDNKIELTEFSLESETFKDFQAIINSEHSTTPKLPTTFCKKCISKLKVASQFKKLCLESEKYLLSFLQKVNQEFKSSLSNFSGNRNNDDTTTSSVAEGEEEELEFLFQEEEDKEQPQPPPPITPAVIDNISKTKIFKPRELVKEKIEVKQEKTFSSLTTTASNDIFVASTSSENDQQQIEGTIFDDKEMYDIMEIEGNEADIYVDEAGNTILNTTDDEEGNEYILVNYKSDDLSDGKQFILERDEENDEYNEDDDYLLLKGSEKTPRKKHVKRMPREIVDKYAQSTDKNQHICTKCVKVFSTRTNLIRHIQSHDGNKPYVCEVCKKGFTQSGSLKQHMYIHSGERPYKCNFCEKAFTQGKTLKFHLRRHLDEKPFPCSECACCFRQRDGLKRHLKSRHNIKLKYERSVQADEKIIAYVNMEDQAEDKELTEDLNQEEEDDKKMEI